MEGSGMARLEGMLLLDFETTGVDPDKDLPVEVCAVRFVGDKQVSILDTLVYYPQDKPWTDALEMGHHSRQDLLQGLDERTVAAYMFQLLKQAVDAGHPLVAYNVLFDASFLYKMLTRHFSVDEIAGVFQRMNMLDPLTIVREREPYPHRLSEVCLRRGIQLVDAHRALDDALAMAELVEQLGSEVDLRSYINRIGFNRQYGVPPYVQEWAPPHVELVPQGSVTIYKHADGRVSRQRHIGRPYQQKIMGKPVPPNRPVVMSPGAGAGSGNKPPYGVPGRPPAIIGSITWPQPAPNVKFTMPDKSQTEGSSNDNADV
jgi:DNA polymerase III epsilon subunit-like protein